MQSKTKISVKGGTTCYLFKFYCETSNLAYVNQV